MEEQAAGGVVVLGVGVGELLTDVGQASGAEQGIDEGVDGDIGVAVAVEAAVAVDVDAGEPEGAAGHQSMQVVSLSDADDGSHFGSVRVCWLRF